MLYKVSHFQWIFFCIITAPSSPGNQRKLLYATRGLKTGSVDLPDEVEKSLSSASTSPCPSPVRQTQVPAKAFHCKILKFKIFSQKLFSNLTTKNQNLTWKKSFKFHDEFFDQNQFSMHAIASVFWQVSRCSITCTNFHFFTLVLVLIHTTVTYTQVELIQTFILNYFHFHYCCKYFHYLYCWTLFCSCNFCCYDVRFLNEWS